MKPFKYLSKPLRVLLLTNAIVFVFAFFGRGLEVNLGAGYGSLTDYINYYTGAKIGELMGDPNFGCRQNGDPRYGGYAD